MRRLLFLAFPLLAACNSTANGTIQIITDDEAGTFTQSPVPTQITVLASNSDGGAPITLATAAYPTSTIDLGNQDQNAVAALAVQATAANGQDVIYGASVTLQYGALTGETLPIFVQRVGQTARLPNPTADSRQSPTLAVLSGRFLIAGGGAETGSALTTWVYDFAQYDLLTPPPTLPIAPASMPLVGTIALLLDGSGAAQYFDFSGSTTTYTVAPPTNANGYTFADVSGGQVIYDDTDGYVFVVGATRTAGAATAAVLMINPNDTSNSTYEIGNMSFLQLSTPRLGASAAWVPPWGLVVAGGNQVAAGDAGATGAGVEYINPAGTPVVSKQLPYPAELSVGAGMTSLGDNVNVLVAGGVLPSGADPGVRAINLGCSLNCAAQYWPPSTQGALPLPITAAAAFDVDAANAIVVGSELPTGKTPGRTHLFTLTTAGATEVPTMVPHTNAVATLSPVGSIVIYGGSAGGEIESFTPAPPQ